LLPVRAPTIGKRQLRRGGDKTGNGRPLAMASRWPVGAKRMTCRHTKLRRNSRCAAIKCATINSPVHPANFEPLCALPKAATLRLTKQPAFFLFARQQASYHLSSLATSPAGPAAPRSRHLGRPQLPTAAYFLHAPLGQSGRLRATLEWRSKVAHWLA